MDSLQAGVKEGAPDAAPIVAAYSAMVKEFLRTNINVDWYHGEDGGEPVSLAPSPEVLV